MKTSYVIRHLVEKALNVKKLTPDIENEINFELTRLGYISDDDYEALELLMEEMDAGRIQLVPSIWVKTHCAQSGKLWTISTDTFCRSLV